MRNSTIGLLTLMTDYLLLYGLTVVLDVHLLRVSSMKMDQQISYSRLLLQKQTYLNGQQCPIWFSWSHLLVLVLVTVLISQDKMIKLQLSITFMHSYLSSRDSLNSKILNSIFLVRVMQEFTSLLLQVKSLITIKAIKKNLQSI